MKTILIVLAGLCLFTLSSVAQTSDHLVIEKVEAWYKPQDPVSDTGYQATPLDIIVRGMVYVTLRNGNQAKKIYLKIKDEQTQAVEYDVNYLINSGDVISQGITIYQKQGNVLSIANPSNFVLKLYMYELYTEDEAGVKSTVYSIIQ